MKISPFLPLLVLPLLASCGREAAAPPAPPPPEVTAITLAPEPVTLTRQLSGRTTPYLVAEVRPQVGGIVQKRLFTEGGMVEAGQPLYQLDDASYQASHLAAVAARERARAALQLARLNAERTNQLAEADAVSRQEHESAMAVLQQAEAELKAAEASVAASEVTLSYSRITAPISGQIGRSSVTQGALVTANQPTALATVQQLDPIYVDLSQSSRELLELRRDIATGRTQAAGELPVTILLEDDTVYQHEGRLAFSEVTVDPATGSFGLRVIVPNPDHLLLPGMFVRAVISTGVREEGLLVPQRAVARNARGETTAMVVGPNDQVEQRIVQVSRTIADQWLVEGGLAAGDRVIIEGLQKVQPGLPVRVQPFVPPSSEAPATAGSN